jgi:hypothetical protein
MADSRASFYHDHQSCQGVSSLGFKSFQSLEYGCSLFHCADLPNLGAGVVVWSPGIDPTELI